jgi:hypothetical protein
MPSGAFNSKKKEEGEVGSAGDICGDRWLKMEKKGVKWGMSVFYARTA